ncbi:MAG: 3-isopropylmalate dehydratase large subunit [Oligoflexales bacterium]
MGKNIIEKIWDSHVVKGQVTGPDIFAIDVMLLHEVTSPQAFAELRKKGLSIFQKECLFSTVDHSIPTDLNRDSPDDPLAKEQIETLRKNVKEHGIELFDIDSGKQGIVHVIGPEQGITQPGMTLVCGDSHTSTHGAFGTLAFGIGTSEVAHVLATGCILQEKPKTMRVNFKGLPSKSVYSKDVIMALIKQIGVDGANGYCIEYAGEWIKAQSMEGRMTVCNMSIECGARAGLIAPDDKTFAYLKGRAFAPSGKHWKDAVVAWTQLESDGDAQFDHEFDLDLTKVKPMVSWGTNPEQCVDIEGIIPALNDQNKDKMQTSQKALDYMGFNQKQTIAGTSIQWAFLGSCTNGRIEDLRIAANVIKGKKVFEGVTFYVVPGSEQVEHQADKEGLLEIFTKAGAIVRKPGCSMCIGMNNDKVPRGARCISTSNRNFIGRQGTGSYTHLASPATVTASAIKGRIASAE